MSDEQKKGETRLGNMCRARDKMHPAKVSIPDQETLVNWMDHGGTLGGTSGTTDHGELTGLTDDDHTQYHNDVRAYTKVQVDSAIDTDITTHTAIAAAHHTRYTDSEAKTATVSDAAYGSGWSSVTDVAPSKKAVYDKIQTMGGDVTYLERLGMYGSANAEWVPLIFENASPDADNTGIPAGAAVCEVSNVVYAASQWTYGLALPPAKNQLKLYVAASGIRFYLSAANATNYVTDVWLIGVGENGTVTTIYTDATDRNAAALVTPANSLTDLSSYEKIFVKLSSTQATANALKVKFVSMKVYYAA